MSVQAISWALSVQTGDPGAKIVLITLANYADDRGRCWPAQSTIASQTEQSIDTVQRRIKDLEELKLLVRRERKHQNGKKGGLFYYYLLMPGIEEILAAEETIPQTAVSSDQTIPQTEPNHTANDPKTVPHSCGTKHYLITTNSSTGSKNLDLNGSKQKGYPSKPGSPEFLSWKAYLIAAHKKSFVRELERRELEGRAFNFESQWPPSIALAS